MVGCSCIISFLKIIGYLKLIEIAVRMVLTYIRSTRTTDNLSTRYGKGSYALVTGGSDGVGLAICKELAVKGFNLVIVSRSMDNLKKAAVDIASHVDNHNTKLKNDKDKLNCDIQLLEFDFSKTQEINEYKNKVLEKVKHLDISILVNNAGYS
jgi:17beta-estradiol 17-dehydrogenase / very-long-chain 3-oxoacyl-CoA reductase